MLITFSAVDYGGTVYMVSTPAIAYLQRDSTESKNYFVVLRAGLRIRVSGETFQRVAEELDKA